MLIFTLRIWPLLRQLVIALQITTGSVFVSSMGFLRCPALSFKPSLQVLSGLESPNSEDKQTLFHVILEQSYSSKLSSFQLCFIWFNLIDNRADCWNFDAQIWNQYFLNNQYFDEKLSFYLSKNFFEYASAHHSNYKQHFVGVVSL